MAKEKQDGTKTQRSTRSKKASTGTKGKQTSKGKGKGKGKAEESQEKKLTALQRAFIVHYCNTKNATESAMLAGYASKETDEEKRRAKCAQQGHENLKKPEIAREIEKKIGKMFERIEIDTELVLQQLARIATADMTRFVTWDDQGKIVFRPSDQIDGTLITEFSETVTGKGRTKKIKLADKTQAIRMLGEYLMLFTEKREITHNAGPGLGEVLAQSWSMMYQGGGMEDMVKMFQQQRKEADEARRGGDQT